jgi:hypothetical protein
MGFVKANDMLGIIIDKGGTRFGGLSTFHFRVSKAAEKRRQLGKSEVPGFCQESSYELPPTAHG